jgi:hypothetical protein
LHFYKDLDLIECSYILAETWNGVKSDTLKKAWGKLFGKSNEDVRGEITHAELVTVVSEISSCSDCGLREVTEWINSDDDDPAFKFMTEEETIENINQETDENDDNDEKEVKEKS